MAQVLRTSYSIRARNADVIAAKIVRQLRAESYSFMRPACEACDDESGWYE